MRKYWVLLSKLSFLIRLSIIDAFEYRLDILGFVLSGIARPIASLAIWLAIFSTGNQVPMSKDSIIQYYLLLIPIQVLVGAWASQFLSTDIRLGKISPKIIKPVPFIFFWIGNNLGEKIIKCLYMLPLVIGLFIVFGQKFPVPSLTITFYFMISLVAAACLHFLTNYVIGLLAFWTEDASSIDDFLDLLLYFFSGRLFPLAILSVTIGTIANILPFRYSYSFPLEIILGQINSQQILTGFMGQGFWLFSFVILSRLIWQKGLKRYTAVGA